MKVNPMFDERGDLEQPKVVVVVLNWNGRDDSMQCLKSLQHIDYSNYEAVVVDNASTDGSQILLRESFPNITLIQNCSNLGFADGNNTGMKYALRKQADYVFLLNNDTVVDQDLLLNLVEAGEKNTKVGVMCPKIYFYHKPDTIWFAGATIDQKLGMPRILGYGELDNGDFEKIEETDYAAGCALMIKAEVIRKIGFLDPRFYLLFEEVDWCFRAREAGYQVICVPNAKVWHKTSASFGGSDSASYLYYFTRNNLLLVKKTNYFEKRRAYMCILKNAFFNIHALCRKKGSHRWVKIRAIVSGIVDFARNRYGEGPIWIWVRDA